MFHPILNLCTFALLKQAEAAIAEREALLAASKPVTETAPITPKAEPTVEQKPIIEPVTAPILPEPEPVVIQHVTATEKPITELVTEQKPIEQLVTVAETKQPETVVKADEKNEDPWSAIRGMRNSAAMIAELEQGGVMSYSELSSFFFRYKRKDDHTDELEKLKNKIEPIEELIKKMKYHDTLVPVYREYKSKTGWSQSRFRKKNAEQIEAYEKTSAYIKEHIKSYYVDGKPPTIGDLMDMSNKLKTQYNSLLPEHNAFLTKKAVAGKYTKVVKNYVNEKEMKRRREISNQKIKQKKKGVWLE